LRDGHVALMRARRLHCSEWRPWLPSRSAPVRRRLRLAALADHALPRRAAFVAEPANHVLAHVHWWWISTGMHAPIQRTDVDWLAAAEELHDCRTVPKLKLSGFACCGIGPCWGMILYRHLVAPNSGRPFEYARFFSSQRRTSRTSDFRCRTQGEFVTAVAS
jgi:hypothetical protein